MLRNHLNTLTFCVSTSFKAALALTGILALSLIIGACGKRKAPLPPNERVSQRSQVSAFQRGNEVRLSWTLPARNAAQNSLLNISAVDVYRLAEATSSSQSLTEEEFAARSTLIATVAVNDTDFQKKAMNYADKLEFAGNNVRLRYAVRFVNASGSRAAFSNFFLIQPANDIATAPTAPVAVTGQDFVKLSWKPPVANIDGTAPPNILGYNVYRSSDGQPAALVNKSPVTQSEFEDRTFEFKRSYVYFVRTISVGTDAQPIESKESELVSMIPIDTFPPSAPAGITLAASPSVISIFFAANPERDIAGYKIFRSADKMEWILLTPDLIPTTTFQDRRVESGKTYRYAVVAVDVYGNESARSEVFEETVP